MRPRRNPYLDRNHRVILVVVVIIVVVVPVVQFGVHVHTF